MASSAPRGRAAPGSPSPMSLKSPSPPYPRSFHALLLAAFALVMLPLVVGMLYTAYAQQRLALQTREAIRITVDVTRATRQASEDLSALQRAAGQYYVLQDPQLRVGMRDAHQALQGDLRTLRTMPFDALEQARLQRIGAAEAALYEELGGAGPADLPRFDAFAPRFAALASSIDRILNAGNLLVDRQVGELGRQSRTLRAALLLQAGAALLLSALIAALLSWVLTRPLRQIDQAIRKLGAGDLQPQPQVRGPRDLVQLGHQLDWLRRRLRETDEQKQRFLRHVSHELKTPLASLREGVELLLDGVAGPLGTQQREIGTIMRGNARDLQQRIENLIDYSRAQRRLDPLVSAGVNLNELLASLVRRNELALRAKHVAVQIDGEATALQADQGKLDTLFENLLINAMRFSPAAGIVRIRLRDDGEAVTVSVSDDGPGVAEQDREHLFEPFFQGMRQPAGAAPGNGLGLAIAQEYAALHGGQIRLCEKSESSGACFCVRLPHLHDPVPAAFAAPTRNSTPSRP